MRFDGDLPDFRTHQWQGTYETACYSDCQKQSWIDSLASPFFLASFSKDRSPERASENSPAIHRRVRAIAEDLSPEGTTEPLRTRYVSSLRDSRWGMDCGPRDKSLGYYLSSLRDSEPAWGWSFHTIVVLEANFGFLRNSICAAGFPACESVRTFENCYRSILTANFCR